jgi:chemotaxis protein MotB
MEAARAAEAAAARALRERLANAQDELTAMELALEEQRRRAEETLTLLAAAEAAKAEMAGELEATEEELAAARETMTEREAMLQAARRRLSEEERVAEDEARRVALLNSQVKQLRRQLNGLQELLDAEESENAELQAQISSLGNRLNAALARELQLKRREAERRAEEIARLEAENRSLEARRSEFFGRIREAIGDREGVEVVGDRFVFQSEVLFGPGSAELGADGRAALDEFAGLFREVRDALPDEIPWILRVDGHTDSTPLSGQGRYKSNWELSQARALSVVRYLVDEQGFPPERLAATGFGEYQPVAPGDTPEGRARNRRIELKLTER